MPAKSTSLHVLSANSAGTAFQQGATRSHHSAAGPAVASWLEKHPAHSSTLPATALHPVHFEPLHEVLCGDDRPLSKSLLTHGFRRTLHFPG